MSQIVISNLGKCELLDKMLIDALSTDEHLFLKLYKNDYTPVATSIATDFTEADFSNYAQKTLTRSGWVPSTLVSNKARAEYAQQTWTCGATTNVVYGYYIVGQNSAKQLWAEKFDTGVTLTELDLIEVTPKFNFTTES